MSPAPRRGPAPGQRGAARPRIGPRAGARESAWARSGSLSAALSGRREVMPEARLSIPATLNIRVSVLERRQDPCRELRRAAALDELDERVQVHPAFARELVGQTRLEARPAQTRSAPRHDVGRPAATAGVVSDSKVHASLAPGPARFLPRSRFTRGACAARDWRTCFRPPPPGRARPGFRGVERETRGPEPRPPAPARRHDAQACGAAREERDPGGAMDRDRLVIPKPKRSASRSSPLSRIAAC
jgi:hypothetical protein